MLHSPKTLRTYPRTNHQKTKSSLWFRKTTVKFHESSVRFCETTLMINKYIKNFQGLFQRKRRSVCSSSEVSIPHRKETTYPSRWELHKKARWNAIFVHFIGFSIKFVYGATINFLNHKSKYGNIRFWVYDDGFLKDSNIENFPIIRKSEALKDYSATTFKSQILRFSVSFITIPERMRPDLIPNLRAEKKSSGCW